MVIIYEGGMNKYYARPSVGEFVERITQQSHTALDGHLLDARWVEEDRFRDGIVRNYYDLAFVDQQSYCSVISLLGDSAAAVSRKVAGATTGIGVPPYVYKARFHFVQVGSRPAHVQVAFMQANEIEMKTAKEFVDGPWATTPWRGV